MIIRNYASCNTCGEKYILRAGVGTEKYQLHSFDCKTCGLPISVVVRANPPSAYFQAEENVTIEEHEEKNAIVINLHPFFAFNKDEIHDRMALPSLLYMNKITPYLRFVSNRKFLGIETQDTGLQFNVPNASHLWTTVKNIFLLKNGDGQDKRIKKAIEYIEVVALALREKLHIVAIFTCAIS